MTAVKRRWQLSRFVRAKIFNLVQTTKFQISQTCPVPIPLRYEQHGNSDPTLRTALLCETEPDYKLSAYVVVVAAGRHLLQNFPSLTKAIQPVFGEEAASCLGSLSSIDSLHA